MWTLSCESDDAPPMCRALVLPDDETRVVAVGSGLVATARNDTAADRLGGYFGDPAAAKQVRRALVTNDQLCGVLGEGSKQGAPLLVEHMGTPESPSYRGFIETPVADARYRLFTSRGAGRSMLSSDLPASIDIATGLCLFGRQSSRCVHRDWSHPTALNGSDIECEGEIVEIVAHDAMSFYEYESIVRITDFIGSLAAALPEPAITVLVDIPCAHYYTYYLDKLASGEIAPETFLAWCELVDVRHDTVYEAFVTRLFERLARLGRTGVRIEHVDSFGRAGDVMVRHAQRGTLPSLDQLADELARNDRVWRELLRSSAPRTALDLGYLAYLRGFVNVDGNGGAGGKLVIQAENYGEHRMLVSYVKARRRIARQGTLLPPAIGLYPLTEFLTTGHSGRSNPYWHASGSIATNAAGRRFNLFDLVDAASLHRAGTPLVEAIAASTNAHPRQYEIPAPRIGSPLLPAG